MPILWRTFPTLQSTNIAGPEQPVEIGGVSGASHREASGHPHRPVGPDDPDEPGLVILLMLFVRRAALEGLERECREFCANATVCILGESHPPNALFGC